MINWPNILFILIIFNIYFVIPSFRVRFRSLFPFFEAQLVLFIKSVFSLIIKESDTHQFICGCS